MFWEKNSFFPQNSAKAIQPFQARIVYALFWMLSFKLFAEFLLQWGKEKEESSEFVLGLNHQSYLSPISTPPRSRRWG